MAMTVHKIYLHLPINVPKLDMLAHLYLIALSNSLIVKMSGYLFLSIDFFLRVRSRSSVLVDLLSVELNTQKYINWF